MGLVELSFSFSPAQILFSADDEMEDSDGDDDVRRITGLKSVKKKKHRLGIPVWFKIIQFGFCSFTTGLYMDRQVEGMTKSKPIRHCEQFCYEQWEKNRAKVAMHNLSQFYPWIYPRGACSYSETTISNRTIFATLMRVTNDGELWTSLSRTIETQYFNLSGFCNAQFCTVLLPHQVVRRWILNSGYKTICIMPPAFELRKNFNNSFR